jgi:hypothetical protein
MKKFYFLTIIMLLLITSSFSQKELYHKGQEKPETCLEKENVKPESLKQSSSLTGEKKTIKTNKGNRRLDSIINYSFTSESDSTPSFKYEYEYNGNGN